MNTITIYHEIRDKVKFILRRLKLEQRLTRIGRPLKITPADAIAAGLLKQRQNIETKKSAWELLEPSCSYKTFVVSLNRWSKWLGTMLALILKINRGNAHLVKHTDATDIPVSLNKNVRYHKTMSGLAAWGKTGKGWFYGLKLHLTSDLKHKVLAIKFTAGNVHDGSMTVKLNKGLYGIFVADAAYLGDKLSKEFYIEHRRILFTAVRKNMKKLMTRWQDLLYKTRMQIEINFRNLKCFYGLVTSMPRSIDGFFAHYLYSLLAYMIA